MPGKLEPLPLTDQQFQSVISEASLAVAIEFWSFRCEACRKMAPVVSQIAAVGNEKKIILQHEIYLRKGGKFICLFPLRIVDTLPSDVADKEF